MFVGVDLLSKENAVELTHRSALRPAFYVSLNVVVQLDVAIIFKLFQSDQ